MAKKSVRSLTESLALKQKEHRWNKVVTALAAVVVFCTTYALILPAITMEREPLCGQEEHVHTDECYQMPMELSCSCQLEAMAGTAPVVVHTHNEYCYDAQGNLVCALPEVQAHQHDDSCYTLVPAEDGHFHNDSCYTERQELTCGLAESEGHTHGPDCYADTLVCAIPENHVHGDGCYEDVLTCTDESEGHVHGPGCYEHRLTCTIPENHVHGADCYKAATVCGLEESAGHTHGPECYTTVRDLTCTEPEGQYDKVLTCTRQEIIVHTHSAACYNEAGELICPLQQVYEHVHGPECWTPVPGAEAVPVCGMEEHTHTDECFSDEFADVETAEDWEATLPKELSGKWAEDVLAVAYSQLGYQESSLNVIFDENGDPHGYTRYGAFMGRPYDDWCAHFVDFVHHYAGLPIDAFPQYPGCSRWCDKLEEDNFGVYFKPGEYEPQPGDCIFFDMDEQGIQDHMGIVEKLIPATEEEPAKVQTIEGNAGNCVQQVIYELDDPRILGYASIAAAKDRYDRLHPTYYCGLEEHTHSDDCYDAEGTLICERPEHTHTDACLSETVYYCGLEEHTHGDDCYDDEGSLICQLPEHTHDAACLVEVVYYCGMGEHIHGDSCYDDEGNLICALPEHIHVDACRIPRVYYCGKEEHTHGDKCYDEAGNLVCELEEHTHDEMCLLQEQTVEAQIIAPVNPFAEDAEQTTIQVTGLMPPGAVVQASPVYLGEEYGSVICAYNITIYDGQGSVFAPVVPLQVTLKVPGLDMSENAEYTVFNVPKQTQEEPALDIREPGEETQPQEDAELAAPAEGDMGILACSAALPQGQVGILAASENGTVNLSAGVETPAAETPAPPVVTIPFTKGPNGEFLFPLDGNQGIVALAAEAATQNPQQCPDYDDCPLSHYLDHWEPCSNTRPFGGAQDFNLFLLGDLNGWGQTHGNAAIMGDILSSNHGVGYDEGSSFDYAGTTTEARQISLLLGGEPKAAGKVTASNGSVLIQEIYDDWTKIDLNATGTTHAHFHHVTKEALDQYFEWASADATVAGSLRQHNWHMDEYARTIQYANDGHYGTITHPSEQEAEERGMAYPCGVLHGENPFYNVFNLTSDEYKKINDKYNIVYLDIPSDSYTIINILPENDETPYVIDSWGLQIWYKDSENTWIKQPAKHITAGVSYDQSQMTMVNFSPDIEEWKITLQGDYLYASVMAPNVKLDVTSGDYHLQGTIVLGEIIGNENENSSTIYSPFVTGSTLNLTKDTVCDHPADDGHVATHLPESAADNSCNIDDAHNSGLTPWSGFYADLQFNVTTVPGQPGIPAVKKHLPMDGSPLAVSGLSPGNYQVVDEVVYIEKTDPNSTENSKMRLTIDENGYWMRVRYVVEGQTGFDNTENRVMDVYADHWTLYYCNADGKEYIDANGGYVTTPPENAEKITSDKEFPTYGHFWNYAAFRNKNTGKEQMSIDVYSGDILYFDLVNHYDVERSMTVSAIKRWQDDKGFEVTAPNARITVALYEVENGTKRLVTGCGENPAVISAGTDWMTMWTGLDPDSFYIAVETIGYPGYTSTGPSYVTTDCTDTNGNGKLDMDEVIWTNYNQDKHFFLIQNVRQEVGTTALTVEKLWYNEDGFRLTDAEINEKSDLKSQVTVYRQTGTVEPKENVETRLSSMIVKYADGTESQPGLYYGGSDVDAYIQFFAKSDSQDVKSTHSTGDNSHGWRGVTVKDGNQAVAGKNVSILVGDPKQVVEVDADNPAGKFVFYYPVTIRVTIPNAVGTKYLTFELETGECQDPATVYMGDDKNEQGMEMKKPSVTCEETRIADRWIHWDYNVATGIKKLNETDFPVYDENKQDQNDVELQGFDWEYTWNYLPLHPKREENAEELDLHTFYRYYVMETDMTEGYEPTYTYYQVDKEIGNLTMEEIQAANEEAVKYGQPEPYPGVTSGFITVQNRPTPKGGPELPMTGGIGTHWYTFGGLFLSLLALLYMIKNRRKEVFPS